MILYSLLFCVRAGVVGAHFVLSQGFKGVHTLQLFSGGFLNFAPALLLLPSSATCKERSVKKLKNFNLQFKIIYKGNLK